MYTIKELVNDRLPPDATDDEIREWLKTVPSKNYEKHCGICEAPINMKYWFCKRCAWEAPLIRCPECGIVNIVAEPAGIDCSDCGVSLDRLCNMENGLLGLAYKEWPETYKTVVRDLRREEYSNQQYDEYTEEYEYENGDESIKVQSQAYSNWATERCSNELLLEEVLEKYGVTQLEFDLLITDDLKQFAEHIGMNYNTAQTKRYRLKKKLATKSGC